MKTDPIQLLEELNERWPNFFGVIKAINGFDDGKMGYPEMMALNEAIVTDQQGIEMALKAFMVISASDDPEHLQWLQTNGFISKAALELKQRCDELEALLLSNQSEEEVAETLRELEELSITARKLGEATATTSARGLGAISTLID
jgi:hypothetical protein